MHIRNHTPANDGTDSPFIFLQGSDAAIGFKRPHGRVEVLPLDIQVHQLFDCQNVVRRQFLCLFEGLTCFISLFLLTKDLSKKEITVGRIGVGLDLLAKYFGKYCHSS